MLPQLKQMMSSMPPDFLVGGGFWLRFPVWGVILPPTDLKTETQVKIHNLKFDHDFSLRSLGISSSATPAEIKAAYHAKLKNFQPRHPEEFKAIQLPTMPFAKENPRKLMISFFSFAPSKRLLLTVVQQLRQRVVAQLEVSLEDDSRNVLRDAG